MKKTAGLGFSLSSPILKEERKKADRQKKQILAAAAASFFLPFWVIWTDGEMLLTRGGPVPNLIIVLLTDVVFLKKKRIVRSFFPNNP